MKSSKLFKFLVPVSFYVFHFFKIIANAGQNEIFDYYLERLDSQSENKLEIIASLWILRHLISRFYEQIAQHLKKMLYVHIKALSNESEFEVYSAQ